MENYRFNKYSLCAYYVQTMSCVLGIPQIKNTSKNDFRISPEAEACETFHKLKGTKQSIPTFQNLHSTTSLLQKTYIIICVH